VSIGEPTIVCPSCQSDIKLTDAMAAPLVAATKRQYEKLLSEKESDINKREAQLREQQTAITKAQEAIDEQVAAKIKTERAAIIEKEAQKARDAVADEITQTKQEKAATEELLKQRDIKLAEAQKNELSLRQERQQLHEEKDQFELEKQRAIDAERVKIREAVQKDADENARLRLAEKDKTITDLQVKLQDALRKAEQGSQQLQGEVQELELETLLRTRFQRDTIIGVPKGEHGGDIIHQVYNSSGQNCGTILWEAKRTKNWSDSWLTKLRDDQRAAKADIAVLISQILPKHIETFDLTEGVWVTSSQCAVPIAVVLRESLIELATVRQAGEGLQTKSEMVYQYLTGPRFRQRVQAIVEAFSSMKEDLDKEKKVILKQWAKRDEQISRVMNATVSMYGDLQGIAGKSLQEIEGLEIKVIEAAPSLDEAA
jgi:hypothetical protein